MATEVQTRYGRRGSRRSLAPSLTHIGGTTRWNELRSLRHLSTWNLSSAVCHLGSLGRKHCFYSRDILAARLAIGYTALLVRHQRLAIAPIPLAERRTGARRNRRHHRQLANLRHPMAAPERARPTCQPPSTCLPSPSAAWSTASAACGPGPRTLQCPARILPASPHTHALRLPLGLDGLARDDPRETEVARPAAPPRPRMTSLLLSTLYSAALNKVRLKEQARPLRASGVREVALLLTHALDILQSAPGRLR